MSCIQSKYSQYWLIEFSFKRLRVTYPLSVRLTNPSSVPLSDLADNIFSPPVHTRFDLCPPSSARAFLYAYIRHLLPRRRTNVRQVLRPNTGPLCASTLQAVSERTCQTDGSACQECPTDGNICQWCHRHQLGQHLPLPVPSAKDVFAYTEMVLGWLSWRVLGFPGKEEGTEPVLILDTNEH